MKAKNSIALMIAFLMSIVLSLNVNALTSEELNADVMAENSQAGITLEQDPTSGTWRAYQNGVPSSYTGFVSNSSGIWVCQNGIVNFNYNGFVDYKDEKWFAQNGKVALEYSGKQENKNEIYTIENGKVVKESLPAKQMFMVIGFFALVAAFIAYMIYRRKKRKELKREQADKAGNEQPFTATDFQTVPYRRKYLLTPNEYSFYQTLKPIADALDLAVLTKVRMGDLVEPLPTNNKSEWYSNWGRVKARHVDFALADPSNLYVKLLIELDDSSHDYANSADVDKFKDAVYEATGYKLLRVRDTMDLEKKIRQELGLEETTPEMVQ